MSITFNHRNLPSLLLQARESVMAHFAPNLRKEGLTDQQWRVLRVLSEQGTSDTGTIASSAYLLGPSLSGVLTRMERDGLISRVQDDLDARRTLVSATTKGKRIAQRLLGSIEAHYQFMETSVGKPQLAQLYALLDSVIALNKRNGKP